MKTIAIIISLLLCSLSVAEEDVPQLPSSIEKKKESYEKKVAEIVAKAQKEYEYQREKYIKTLEKEVKNATKRGNLEGALAIQAEIESLKKEQPIADLFGDLAPAGKTFVEVQAKDFHRSSQETQRQYENWSNLTLTFRDIEYDVLLEQKGEFYLHVCYAARDSRPLDLIINEETLENKFCAETTGGWHAPQLQWKTYGPYTFKKGKNVIKFSCKGERPWTPHLKSFAISSDGAPPPLKAQGGEVMAERER